MTSAKLSTYKTMVNIEKHKAHNDKSSEILTDVLMPYMNLKCL